MKEYQPYRSPIRLLNDLGLIASDVNDENLNSERKRLFLEIQISQTNTVQIGKRICTKNDVIEIFDELSGVSEWNFHLMIFDRPELLDFLENSRVERKLPDNHKIEFNTQKETDKFIEFVSPYLANAIHKLLAISVDEMNFLAIDRIQSYFQFLKPADAIFAFQAFNYFCKTLNYELEDLAKHQKIFALGNTYFLHYTPFYSTANCVEHYYPGLTDIIAEAVINFTQASKKTFGRRQSLVTISKALSTLNCSEHLKLIINENHILFSKTVEVSEAEKMIPQLVLRYFVLIIIAIYAISKFFGTDDELAAASNSNEQFNEQMQQLQQELNADPNRQVRSNLIKGQFREFHQKVINVVKDKSHDTNVNNLGSQPGMRCRFIDFDTGSKYKLTNKTNSDMLMIVWGPTSLNWFFVKRNKTTNFSAEYGAKVFFYSGQQWDSTTSIFHRPDLVSSIIITGTFRNVSDIEFEFLRKRFTIDWRGPKNLTIKDKKSKYELFQGNKPVDYRF